jgi:ABC-type Mn2+/Zn2+ transport system ATPase subunit
VTALVELERAAIGYGDRPLLSGVDLAVAPGDFLAIIGPNGGGKTTLVRTLLGVLPPLAGRRVQPAPMSVGYVPQRDHVDPRWPLTTAEVAMMGRAPRLGASGRPGEPDRAAVAAALARTGISALSARPFRTLSGGQRQRTLLARALAAQPDLLVLDEPTNGMDPGAELATLDLLRELHGGGRLAIVMVSHRIEAVVNYARTIALVDWERRVWTRGGVDEVLRSDALPTLYGRGVAVREEGGRRYVHPVDGARP